MSACLRVPQLVVLKSQSFQNQVIPKLHTISHRCAIASATRDTKVSSRVNQRLKSLNEAKSHKLTHSEINMFDKPQSSTHRRRVDNYRPPILYKLPRTITEAKSIVDTYLSNRDLVLFSDSLSPLSYSVAKFLTILGLPFENIALDSFGNRQLLQNYIEELCDNNPLARNPPIVFARKSISPTIDSGLDCGGTANEKSKGKSEEISEGIYMIGADGVATAWQSGKLEYFFPNFDIPTPKPTIDNQRNAKWRSLTQCVAQMYSNLGYMPTDTNLEISRGEPNRKAIEQWSQYVGIPILSKDIGNPQRPQNWNKPPSKAWINPRTRAKKRAQNPYYRYESEDPYRRVAGSG